MEQQMPPQTPLDWMVTTEQDQLLKAALPFFPSQGQRFLSIYLKSQELSRAVRLLQETPQVQICEAPQETSLLSLFRQLRPYAGELWGNKIDQVLHMITMVEMMQIMNEPDE